VTDVLNRAETETRASPRALRGAGPDFICVGAQKAGTRWLYDQLAFHPEFWMPPVKELHFFDGAKPGLRRAKRLQVRIDKDLDKVNRMRADDASQPLGARDLRFVEGYLRLFGNKPLMSDKAAATEHYARLFDEKGERKTGDVTPAYSKLDDGDVEAIVRRFPKVKVVFIAREPVERAWSALGMAARQASSRIKQPLTPAMVLKFLNRKDVVGRSYPSRTVARWRKIVPEGQFAFYFFDDLRTEPADLRARILRFLDADPALPSGDLDPGFNRKSASVKLDLTDELRDTVVKHFADEIRLCADTLGGRAVEWRKKYNL
jgi:hypothetical protein